MTRDLNVHQADPDMRRIVNQAFAADKPLVRVTHEPTLLPQQPGTRQSKADR
jgi:putative intracellular protease/amidase